LNDVEARVTIVAKESGNNDFTIIQDVVNSLPTNNMNLFLIIFKPDTYEEKATIPIEKLFIILSGFDAHNTFITWNYSEK
jgi:pectin methylesterase-like acyl-CoA thioesterase